MNAKQWTESFIEYFLPSNRPTLNRKLMREQENELIQLVTDLAFKRGKTITDILRLRNAMFILDNIQNEMLAGERIRR